MHGERADEKGQTLAFAPRPAIRTLSMQRAGGERIAEQAQSAALPTRAMGAWPPARLVIL
jgi:hypothetical protein